MGAQLGVGVLHPLAEVPPHPAVSMWVAAPKGQVLSLCWEEGTVPPQPHRFLLCHCELPAAAGPQKGLGIAITPPL